MHLFSDDWVKSLAEAARTDEQFQKKAKKFDAVYQYVVKPVPEKGAETEYCFAIKYPEAEQYWIGTHEKPDYTMTTTYQVFHDILAGRTNAVKALMTRKAFVAGNLPNLLRFTGAINRIVELMQAIPAEGEGDYENIGM